VFPGDQQGTRLAEGGQRKENENADAGRAKPFRERLVAERLRGRQNTNGKGKGVRGRLGANTFPGRRTQAGERIHERRKSERCSRAISRKHLSRKGNAKRRTTSTTQEKRNVFPGDQQGTRFAEGRSNERRTGKAGRESGRCSRATRSEHLPRRRL